MDQIKATIKQAGEFLKRPFAAFDSKGGLLVKTGDLAIQGKLPIPAEKGWADKIVSNEVFSLVRLYPGELDSPYLYAEGEGDGARESLQLFALWLRSVSDARNLENERLSFLKNVLFENELPGEIPLKAKEYDIPYELCRHALLISLPEPIGVETASMIRLLLGNDEDHIIVLDENNLVVTLRCSEVDERQTEEISARILSALEAKGVQEVHMGIGLRAKTLKDLARSYREASLALTVGRIFEEDTTVMWYNRLGLGRLIYQLPPTLCEMFLSEVFEPDTYEALDKETLLTIEKFFENNLNGSETSRQLFVHRNTLVYRLDKVQKITGMDLRNFDDAVLFKLASMVRQYLETLQTHRAPVQARRSRRS